MVLEDDLNLQNILVDLLDDKDYSAYGVSSAAEAIAAVTEAEARGEPFDIVLSDIRMAGGMDGLSALEVIKARKPEMQCIVMTGYTLTRMDDPATREAPLRASAIEVDDFLCKPFELSELLCSIDRLRKRREGLIAARLASYRAGQDEKAWQTLRKSRYSVWNFFRVMVRSRYFTVGMIEPVVRFWDVLEEIEARYLISVHKAVEVSLSEEQEVGGSSGVSLESMLRLAQEYDNFRQAAQKRMEARASFGSRPRNDGMVNPGELKQLVLNIQNDRVSVEDLQLAVYCRRAPREAIQANPTLNEVHQRLWLP